MATLMGPLSAIAITREVSFPGAVFTYMEILAPHSLSFTLQKPSCTRVYGGGNGMYTSNLQNNLTYITSKINIQLDPRLHSIVIRVHAVRMFPCS